MERIRRKLKAEVILSAPHARWSGLLATGVICSAILLTSCGERVETKQLETSRGIIQYKERTAGQRGGFSDNLTELTQAQKAKIQTALAQVEPFIRKYVPDQKRSIDLLENLDEAFAIWGKSKDSKKEPAEYVADVVGAGLGQYSIEHLNLKWMAATDEKGTELALVGEDPPTRAYPFASVRYRIEDGKVDFVGAIFEAIKHQRENP